MPARYFYGELKNYWGARIDVRSHYAEKDIKFDIYDGKTGKSGGHTAETGFKHDGRIIFRYRLRYSMPDGKLELLSRSFAK